MSRLPRVPVDAAAVRHGHIIPVDGLIATVTGRPDRRKNKVFIRWEQVDCGPDQKPILGVLPVKADGTVDCIRNADWLASGGDDR